MSRISPLILKRSLLSPLQAPCRVLPKHSLSKGTTGSHIRQRRWASTISDIPNPSQSIFATLLTTPSREHLEESEQDVDSLTPDDQATLEITPSAAEQLRTISTRQNDPKVALRIAVEAGGCHGYQYKMDLTSAREPEDYQFEHPLIKPSTILIDFVSMTLLKGSTVDFATELIGSSFQITENPQAKGSGCGCGVSWEAKI